MESLPISGFADPSPHRPGGIDYGIAYTSNNSREVLVEQFRTRAGGIQTGYKPPKRVVVEEGRDADSQVFQRLGVNGIANQTIQPIADQMLELNALDELVALQAKEPPVDGANWEGPASKQEKAMYPHLTALMDLVDQPDIANSYSRKFYCGGEKQIISDLDETPAKGLKPDLRCGIEDARVWRLLDGWGEVKASSHEFPYFREGGQGSYRLTNFGSQVTHYALMHLSGTPFRLFTFGLLIFGRKFCVASFDRDCVTFSPIRDLRDDVCTFARVLFAFMRRATPVELGLESGIMPIARDAIIGNLPQEDDGFAEHYTIPPIHGDPESRWWITVNRPLWVSKSIIGRCTSVWTVYPAKRTNGQLHVISIRAYVLKNAWRNSAREMESAIYRWAASSVGASPGVATLLVGDDVRGPDGQVVTARHLRGEEADLFDSNVTTATLHRLILNEVGIPVWKFENLLQLVRGFKAALDGHEQLVSRGILHRDISAGNILLSKDADVHGFMSDLEFAYVAGVLEEKEPDTHDSVPTSQSEYAKMFKAYNSKRPGSVPANLEKPHRYVYKEPKRGVEMTGTQLFMAFDILQAIAYNLTLKHGTLHDIESFTYVFGYTVIRRYESDRRTDPTVRARLKKIYIEAFGHTSITKILDNRRHVTGEYHPVGWLSTATENIMGEGDDEPLALFAKWCKDTFSPGFVELFSGMEQMHRDAIDARRMRSANAQVQKKLEAIFSYERLGGLLSAAITALEQEADAATADASSVQSDA